MTNSPEQFNSRFYQAEEKKISEIEDKAKEINKSEKKKEKRMEINNQSLRDLWGTNSYTNTCMEFQETRSKRNEHKVHLRK